MGAFSARGRAHVEHAHASARLRAARGLGEDIARELRGRLLNVIGSRMEIGVERETRTLGEHVSVAAPRHAAAAPLLRHRLARIKTHGDRRFVVQRDEEAFGLLRAQLAPHALCERFGQPHKILPPEIRSNLAQMRSNTAGFSTKSSESLSTISTSPRYMSLIQCSYFSFRRVR